MLNVASWHRHRCVYALKRQLAYLVYMETLIYTDTHLITSPHLHACEVNQCLNFITHNPGLTPFKLPSQSLLMLPAAANANPNTHLFISHRNILPRILLVLVPNEITDLLILGLLDGALVGLVALSEDVLLEEVDTYFCFFIC